MVLRIFSMTLLSASVVDAAEQPPHLLFMMADQMRWDSLSASAGPENSAFRTPALDRLAAEGATVRYAWSSTPTCIPARAALLTGRSPWNHGLLGLGNMAPHYEVEMPRFLAEGGYHTASIGKDHFGWNQTSGKGLDHGYGELMLYDGLGSWKPGAPNSWKGEWDDYDRWFAEQNPGQDPQATLDGFDGDGWNTWHGKAYVYNESLHPTAWVGRTAVEWLRAYPNATTGVQPFMLKVSFHRPHSPYDPPQRVLDTIGEDDLRPQKMCNDTIYDPASDGHGAGWCARFRGGPGHPKGCGTAPDSWCGEMPTDDAVMSRRAYAGSVNFVDEWVGHIYEALVERNLLERTWILWTSDHGDGQGDMHHWRKGYPYEFSAHVPMLLRWPETWALSHPAAAVAARGVVFEAPLVAELRDVFHTMADAAGLARQMPAFNASSTSFEATDGKSLLCLLADPTGKETCDYSPNPGPWRQWIDMEHANCYNGTNHWSALTDGRMKYIQRAWAGDEQLFNLTSDPGETTEVSRLPEYAEELALWRARLVQQFEREGRGQGWVKDGQLVRRSGNQKYSPHHPHGPAPPPMPVPSAGEVVVMHANGRTANCGTSDCWRNSSIQGQDTLAMIDSPSLCLSLAHDTTLEVQVCSDHPSADQHFSTNGQLGGIVAITHVPSGQCIAASKTKGMKPQLVACNSGADDQSWTFGTSGRLCASKFGGLCLRAELPLAAIAETFESAAFI